MLKKLCNVFTACLLTAVLAFTFAGCKRPDPVQPTKDREIEVPIPDTITPPQESVEWPAAPTLSETDSTKAPYITKFGTTTDAYTVAEIKNGSAVTGATISYPATGETLEDWNFVYVDIDNFSKDYSNLRIDFDNVDSAEKIGVSAFYMEEYETKCPPVGVLVESLLDGSVAYSVDLKELNTIDKTYTKTDEKLIDKQICRLFLYIDSNPTQAPEDKEGSLTISSIKFLKDGDPLVVVDNSPFIGDVTASDSYSLVGGYQGVAKAEYSTDDIVQNSNVFVNISRWSNAYGTMKVTFKGTSTEKLSIYSGSEALWAKDPATKAPVSMYGYVPTGESETFTFDFRAYKKLSSIAFYIDSKGDSTVNSDARAFEIEEIEFIYTPYVTDTWSATSFYMFSDTAIGGIATVSYTAEVNWNHTNVQVKHWKPEYRTMVVTFTTTGAERYGVAVNGITVMSVWDSRVADLPYDEVTEEYTLTVDLSSFQRISVLEFYFDSAFDDTYKEFNGTRQVSFTGIEFSKARTDLPPTLGTLGGNQYYAVTPVTDGTALYNVSWADRDSIYGNTPINVINWTEEYRYFIITVRSDNEFTLGVYGAPKAGTWIDKQWLAHTVVAADTEKTFAVPVDFSLGTYAIWLYYDAVTSRAGSANTVTIVDMYFSKTNPNAPAALTFGNMVDGGDEKFVIDYEGSDGEFDVSWSGLTVTSSNDTGYYSTNIPVSGWAADTPYLVLELKSDNALPVGIYLNGNDWAGYKNLTGGGTTDTIVIKMPNGFAYDEFTINFYWDCQFGNRIQAGATVTFVSIDFSETNPNAGTVPTVGTVNGNGTYTVTPLDDGTGICTVEWASRGDNTAVTTMTVNDYSNEYPYLLITLESAAAFKLAIYEGWSTCLLTHTNVLAGTETTLVVPLGNYTGGEIFIFWDYGVDSTVTVKILDMVFSQTNPNAPATLTFGEMSDGGGVFDVDYEGSAGLFDLSWTGIATGNTGSYAASSIDVGGWTTDVRYFVLTLKSDVALPVGIYLNGGDWAGYKNLTGGGTEDTFIIKIPSSQVLGEFTINFYWDCQFGTHTQSAATITFVSMEFVETNPNLGPLAFGNMDGNGIYTIDTSPAEGLCTVSWTGNSPAGYSYSKMAVSNWTDEYQYLVIELKSDVDVKLAVYGPPNDQYGAITWKDHTQLIANTGTMFVIQVPAGLDSENFDIIFYWDCQGGTHVVPAATITIMSINFSATNPNA